MTETKVDDEFEVVVQAPNEPPRTLIARPSADDDVKSLRTAYSNLWNRVGFVEARVSHLEESVKRIDLEAARKREEDFFQKNTGLMLAQPKQGVTLPEKYHEKAFPYISLPLAKAAFWARRSLRKIASYFVSPDPSVEGSRKAIWEADEERNFVNILRLQRHIHRTQEEISKAIRRNQEFLISIVGSYTNDNLVIAYALKNHFCEVGYSDIKITTDVSSIYLHLRIEY